MKQELQSLSHQLVPSFGKTLTENLDGIKNFLRQDNDFIMLLIGRERIGKSNLGLQICRYMENDFNVHRVTFGIDEFQIGLQKAKQYQALQVDEGVETLFSKNTMTRESKQTVQTLTQIGSKNLFVLIIAVDPFLLDKYILSHRAAAMIRIIKRGVYAFYSKDRLSRLTQDPINKKTKYPKANFIENYGKMNDQFWKDYLNKKASFVASNRNQKVWKKKIKLDERLSKSYKLSDLQTIFGVSRGTISQWVYVRNFIPKKYWFMDAFGQRRITEQGYRTLEKKLVNRSTRNW